MVRDPEEFEEEEDYEEDPNEQLIASYHERAAAINKKLCECEPGTEMYGILLDQLDTISSAIKQMEIAGNEKQQKYESQQRSENSGKEDFFRWATLFAPIVGNIVGTTVGEGIRARARHKDIDTITTYEADGNIVKTAAQKLIK